MINRVFAISLTFALCLSGGLTIACGQGKSKDRPATPAAAAVQKEITALLPTSDAVVLVDVQKAVKELLPQLLANRKAKLDEVNAHLDKLKEKTGIDARVFKQVAVGVQYVPDAAKKTTVRSVAIARGDFDAGAMVVAARQAGAGKTREVKAGDKTITVISIAEIKDKVAAAAGTATAGEGDKNKDIVTKVLQQIIDGQSGEVALYAVDQNTLALGDLARVTDVANGKMAADGNGSALALARKVPNSVIGFGGKVPPDLAAQLDFDNEQIDQALNSIRQIFGGVSFTADSYNLLVGVRTDKAEAASDLKATIEMLQGLGGMVTGRIKSEPLRQAAERGIDNLKVTQTGTELQAQLPISQVDAGALLDLWK